MEQNSLYIDFDTIRKSLQFEKESYFMNYLNEVFGDLSFRSENVDTDTSKNASLSSRKKTDKKISKLVFGDYFKLPVFITEKVFASMDKDNDGFLSLNEFTQGMSKLFQGSFRDTAEFIFSIFDYDKDGMISKGDVKLLLSYLPIKSLIESNEYKNQMKSLADIDAILKDTFEDSDTMSLETFIKVVEGKKSDVYLQMLLYLYNKKPFTINSVNSCKVSKKATTLSAKKPNRLNFLTVNQDLDKNLRLPSPSKKTSLEPTEKFFANLNLNVDKEKMMNSTMKSPRMKRNDGVVWVDDEFMFNEDDANINSANEALKISEKKFVSPTNYLKKDGLYKNGSNNGSLIDLKQIDDEQKEDLTMEDNVYKFDNDTSKSNLKTFRKFYLVLQGVEISIYSTSKKQELISFHNLSGTYINEGDSVAKNKVTYYSIVIQLSKNNEIKLYFDSKDIQDKWLHNLKKAIGYQTFTDHYEILNEIGQGTFGVVKLGVHKFTNTKVAVKIITKSKLKPTEYELIRSELDIMKLFHHPHLVRLLDHFENNEFIYIVMEYLSGGDLINLVTNTKPKLTEAQAAIIIKQIAQGIKYLNNYGVIHRDIKPENIMLKEKGDLNSLKIIDFGLTKTLAPNEKLAEGMGTLTFVAPEVIQRNPYNKAVDVWSIGVVMYYLLSGALPFDDENDDTLAKKIVYSDPGYPDQIFGDRSETAKKLISQCLEKKPEKRISIDELLDSYWIKMNSKAQ